MNWDAISAISETIASGAVVLSLMYLAMQIKHSNKISQSQTRTELRHMANVSGFRTNQSLVEYFQGNLLRSRIYCLCR